MKRSLCSDLANEGGHPGKRRGQGACRLAGANSGARILGYGHDPRRYPRSRALMERPSPRAKNGPPFIEESCVYARAYYFCIKHFEKSSLIIITELLLVADILTLSASIGRRDSIVPVEGKHLNQGSCDICDKSRSESRSAAPLQ